MTRVPFNKEQAEALKILGPYDNGVWDDLRSPASTINPPGAEADPDIDPLDGSLLFASNRVEVLFTFQQLPHAWKQGSPLGPHIHWAKTSDEAGTVAWKLEYKLFAYNAVYPSSYTNIGIVSVPDNGNVATQVHALTRWGYIDTSSIDDSTSAMIGYKLSRVTTDLTDTYSADARLFEFDTHYLKDSQGSLHEYTKQSRYTWQDAT